MQVALIKTNLTTLLFLQTINKWADFQDKIIIILKIKKNHKSAINK